MGQGETAPAGVKVTLRGGLGNISRDGSVPLTHLWLQVCRDGERWQKTGPSGMLSFPRVGKEMLLTSCGTQPFGMGKKNLDLKLGGSMAARHPVGYQVWG